MAVVIKNLFSIAACLCLLLSASAPGAGESPTISREVHWAVTEEKFELAMDRLRAVPKPRHRVPVVLASGLFVNSRFLDLTEEHSLAGYLAREGFDVWNLSYRGSGRSLPPLRGGPEIWTLDDMIDRDLIAVNRYIRTETKRRELSWVGFEMGGLLLYGYLAKRGDPAVNLVALGAPVAFNYAAQEPMKRLLSLEDHPTLKKLLLQLNAPFLGRLVVPLVPQIEALLYNPENVEAEVCNECGERYFHADHQAR
jgi:predicted alpha/beta hydrolase